VRTHIVDGLENALQTVKQLYTGSNMGKLMIRVKDASGVNAQQLSV
jgi:NADPH-dependent curcumin reductase CurA